MKIGIVQELVGHIGGNDKVLDALFRTFKDHEIHLFTFSAMSNLDKLPETKPTSTITHELVEPEPKYQKPVIHEKFPVHIPMLGIYQKFLMPQHDYSMCDIVISATAFPARTDKKLIIYDQNNLGSTFIDSTPDKYKHGLWKLYFLPYKLLNRKNKKVLENAIYISNSEYSARELYHASKNEIKADVIYPAVDLSEMYSLPKKEQICVVGRISPEKNLTWAIEILNQVDYPCIIFGNVTATNKGYYNRLKSMAKDHIKFEINKPRDELLKLMAESKIFFSASKETFGITTVEGIASDCIPVVPNNSAHPETVPDDSLRFDSTNDAIRVLNRVINQKTHDISKLKENIKQFSFEEFSRRFRRYL